MLEVGTLLSGINPQSASRVFESAHEAISEMPQPLKDDFLQRLVKKLVQVNLIEKAFEYSLELENEVKRNDSLILVLNSYVNEGNLRNAHRVVEYIQNEPWRSLALFSILKEHLKRGELGTALGLLSQFRSDYWLGEAVKSVAVYLKKSDNLDSAVYEKVFQFMASLSSDVSNDVLKSFLVGLAVQGEIKFVSESLKRIPREQWDEIISAIVSSIIDRGELVTEFLDSLPEDAKILAVGYVLDILLERPPSSEYLELVRKIGSFASSERIKVKAVRYLSKLHDYEGAWNLASSISDPHLRSLAFGSIAIEKLKEGDIDGAIDAALEVKDPRWGSWLLSEILAKIAELQASGQVVEDIEERAEKQKRLWADE
ncbi:hypothetical protein [Thermococcus peptonophilus]|uniref:hypothetical protein n=1 Tax=Thermococcus peptonophilus TaxID=53952 RepID=UPI001E54AB19|nr:hypothetical protein [Thermococcus peptonophilus]